MFFNTDIVLTIKYNKPEAILKAVEALERKEADEKFVYADARAAKYLCYLSLEKIKANEKDWHNDINELKKMFKFLNETHIHKVLESVGLDVIH